MLDPKVWGPARISDRQNEIRKVSELLGFKRTINLGFPTTRLDEIPLGALTRAIAEVMAEVKPEVIYVNNRSDVHSDHRISFDATMSASKTFSHEYIKRVMMYEVVSETDYSPALSQNVFVPNYFVDISKHIDGKIEAMRVYSSELKAHPFPRSEKDISALATFRGAQCGAEFAEAFMILKEIWK